MRKISVQEFVTLDGVMQAPGGPEEDKSSNFQYGGWTAPYFNEADEEAGEFMAKIMQPTDLLLGKKTFDILKTTGRSTRTLGPASMRSPSTSCPALQASPIGKTRSSLPASTTSRSSRIQTAPTST